MILFLSVALAAPSPLPTSCDPSTPASKSAPGYCLLEAEYAEYLKLKQRITALEIDLRSKAAELTAFEDWKVVREHQQKELLGEIVNVHNQSTSFLTATYEANMALCEKEKKRTWLERNAFTIGLGIGVVGTSAFAIGIASL